MGNGSDVPDRVRLEIRGASGRLTPQELAATAVMVDLAAVNGPGSRESDSLGPPGEYASSCGCVTVGW